MTLKDVAEASGCSAATVSKVFKNSAEISEETKQRVIKAAKEVGYIKKATSRPAVLGGLRPVIFADFGVKYSESIVSFEKLFSRYDFTFLYVSLNTEKAAELSNQIGGWGVVTTEEYLKEKENIFYFNGDEKSLTEFLKELSNYVPPRTQRINGNTNSKKLKKEQKAYEKKDEEIWLF